MMFIAFSFAICIKYFGKFDFFKIIKPFNIRRSSKEIGLDFSGEKQMKL